MPDRARSIRTAVVKTSNTNAFSDCTKLEKSLKISKMFAICSQSYKNVRINPELPFISVESSVRTNYEYYIKNVSISIGTGIFILLDNSF